jgi:hypothetical protein
MEVRRIWVIYALTLLFISSLVFGQSTSTITGTVTDPTGAVIAGAEVVCTNQATHLALRTVTNGFKATAMYDLPRLRRGSRILRVIAIDWQINTILTARTGMPLTCRSGRDNSLSGVGGDTCDQVLKDISRPAGADPVDKWFNTAAFTTNAIGTSGETERGILRRPWAVNFDLSLFRRIPITERFLGELRVETFNVNHPNYDLIYNTSSTNYAVNSATFGEVRHASDPRLIPLTLRLRF